MSIAIVGIGTWLPATVRGNDAWPPGFGGRADAAVRPERARTFNDIPAPADPLAAAIVARDLAAEASDPFLGAHERHFADASDKATDASVLAARAALADAGIDASEVDLVLSHDLVPERVCPSSAVTVAHRLGATHATAITVDTACASAIAQIEVARAYLTSGMARVVVLTQSHLVMRTLELMHPASPGLGDAATALVMARAESGLVLRSTFSQSHGEFADAVTWVRPSESHEPMWWQPGGAFRLASLAPHQVKQLMRDTVDFAASTLREAARRADLDIERIKVLASVQPRGFLPHAMAERLGLARDIAVETYATIAHIGACGPVMNLAAAREQRRYRAGDVVALYAQGAGFTRAAAILEVV